MSSTADFYLARADESARDALAAELPNVRERCERSEAAWRVMAERSLKLEQSREKQAALRAAQAGVQ